MKVSFDVRLLKEGDRRPLARKEGRSALVRRVLDDAYRRAYSGKAQEVDDDFGELRSEQVWPDL